MLSKKQRRKNNAAINHLDFNINQSKELNLEENNSSLGSKTKLSLPSM